MRPSWRHLGPSWQLWWPPRSVLEAILGILDALESARDVSWRRQSLGKRGRCAQMDAAGEGGALRRLQKPCQTALGILARLNVPGARWRIIPAWEVTIQVCSGIRQSARHPLSGSARRLGSRQRTLAPIGGRLMAALGLLKPKYACAPGTFSRLHSRRRIRHRTRRLTQRPTRRPTRRRGQSTTSRIPLRT